MNQTQAQTGTSAAIAFLAGLLAGKGVFGFDAETWIAIIGGLGGVIATIWGAIAARKTAIVAEVAAMPEVKQIELEKGAVGARALEEVTPANVVIK